MQIVKKEILQVLANFLEGVMSSPEIETNLEKAKDKSFGDISFPCHPLARRFKKPPIAIAASIAETLKRDASCSSVASVDSLEGYVNFKYKDSILYEHTLNEVLSKKEDYGRNNCQRGQKIIIDYSGPNLGKPMHVGHIRSTIIGDSIIKLLNFSGANTFGINYLGDIGLHIGKLITSYEIYGDKSKLDNNPEKEMFELYVKFGEEAKKNPSLEKRAKKVLEKIESGDKDYLELLSKIQNWSMVAFDRVYSLLKIRFDEITGQSKFSERGKALVKEALERKIARYSRTAEQKKVSMEDEEQGRGVEIDLTKFGLPPKTILRKDGTAIYSTQDLGSAVERYSKHRFNRMVYVVANEQSLYFKQIFKILEVLGYLWSKDCYHLEFGLMTLEEGKMSTRQGHVILLEDVLTQSIKLAREKLDKKEIPEPLKEITANQVGIGAVKYMVLQVDPGKEISFSLDKALDFDGRSAPYIQYAYVRASSILEKCGKRETYKFNPLDFKLPEERHLISRISEFPDKVMEATLSLKPSTIANYLYNLSKDFTSFYSKVKVTGSEEEISRLALVEATKITIKNAAGLLGIDLPERM